MNDEEKRDTHGGTGAREHRGEKQEQHEHEQEQEPEQEQEAAHGGTGARAHGAEEEQHEQEEEQESGTTSVKDLPPEAKAHCKAAVEALLFSTGEPVSTGRLAGAISDVDVDGRGVRSLVGELIREYEESRRGFTIEEVAGGFRLVSRPEYAEYVGNLLGSARSTRLSQAALETLAVVAYKQPVTRADIEAIRGVQAGPLLRSLLQKGLIRITGRAEVIGRPFLYGTTRKFLEYFGLKSLDELPRVDELPAP
ncbi:MAG: SMC-Scp complex subunit ScpB [Planctomycetota bacterium]